MKTSPSPAAGGRGERGAALITALLMTTLLLAAGGALILTSTMAATTAADSTAEMQAYYAAEAGLEASLAVIRRNVAPKTAGVKATFLTAVCGTAATCNNTGGDLSQWLTYSGGVVPLATNLSYSLSVRDARVAQGAALPSASWYIPRYLVVTSTGRGPKGARKVLEMTLDRLSLTYDAPAALVLRQSDDQSATNKHVSIDVGAGGPAYSGQDHYYPTVYKGAVGVGSTSFGAPAVTDVTIAEGLFSSVTTTPVLNSGVVPVGGSGELAWPDVVKNTAAARAFVASAQSSVTSTACPANHTPLNGLTVITGNCSLGSGNNGQGMIVITGQLTLSGDFDYEGLIFVLGDGGIRRNGAGSGKIYGGVLAANFGATGDFGPVVFNTNGGGGSLVQYDSVAIENALASFGPKVVGIVEK
jgi:hypothetical protein